MSEQGRQGDVVMGRRSFLKGSALFAAALGTSAVTAFAGQADQKAKTKAKDKKKEPAKEPSDQDRDKETLVDANGREYRVCPQCGANMYKQGRTWTCDNCGYSYTE